MIRGDLRALLRNNPNANIYFESMEQQMLVHLDDSDVIVDEDGDLIIREKGGDYREKDGGYEYDC